MRQNSERGQSVIFLVMVLVTMFGVLGLAVDIGWAHFRKQAAQSAAEAAALAAVQAAMQSSGTSITCGSNKVACQAPTACPDPIPSPPTNDLERGCVYAKDNGFEAKTGGRQYVTMEANTGAPPTVSGISAKYWVTARVSESLPQGFSGVLGNYVGLASARATVVITSAAPGCIYIMDPTAPGALTVKGTASLTANCGVFINSNSNTALSGNGTTALTATDVEIVGGYSFGGTLNPKPTTGVAHRPDPLAFLQPPDLSTLTVRSTTPVTISGWSITTLLPGIYQGGIAVKNGTAIFSPGVYVIEGGGLTTQDSNSIITGTGVTFYNTCSTPGSCGSTSNYGPFSLSATSTVTLNAPITGTYAGVLIMEDRSIPPGVYSDTFGGGSTAVYTGCIDAPNSIVTFYGNAAATAYTILVADQLSLVGTSTMNSDYAALGGNPIKVAALVE